MSIIIFDGDNTLWDTNKIFTNAQLAILKKLTEYSIDIDPVEEFSTLREFDDMLIKKNNTYEYDFRSLPHALYNHYKNGMDKKEAIDSSYKLFKDNKHDDVVEIAEKCYGVFKNEMKKTPKLFYNIHSTLTELKNKGHILILSSEGKNERIMRILKEHKLDDIFYQISTDKKSKEIFDALIKKTTKISKNKDQVVVVGDMLKREIFIGNSSGATTIFKPGGYKPNQKPNNYLEKPDYTIQCFHELLTIIH